MDVTTASTPLPEPASAVTPAALLRAAVPAELQQSPQWVAYNAKKIPLRILKPDEFAKSDDATTWTTFDQGLALLESKPDGVEGLGFAFSWASCFVYTDLDDCLDENGQLREWAKPYVEPVRGRCYIEVSPSGHGLHIIGKGRLAAGMTLESWGTSSGKSKHFPEYASEWAKNHLPKPHLPEVAVFVRNKYTTITGMLWEGNGTIEQPAEDGSAPWLDEVWTAAGLSLGPSADTAAAASADPAPQIDTSVDSAPFLKDLPGRVVDELKICTPATAADQSDARWAEYIAFHKAGMPPEQILQAIMACDWYERSGAAKKGEKHTLADIKRACQEADEKAAQDAAHESEPSTPTEPPPETESSSGIGDSSEGKEPWSPPDPKPKYLFQRGSEILDEPDLNPLWLIQGLLPESGVGVIGGEPKSTKTWLGMEIGMALATATPACGEFEVREQKTVAVFLAEDGKRSVKARLRALAASRNMEPKAPPRTSTSSAVAG